MVNIIQKKKDIEISNNTTKPSIVIFRGNGRAFSSGGNLLSWHEKLTKEKNTDKIKEYISEEYYLSEYIKNKIPFQISLLHGAVMGFAVGLIINSKIKITTDSTMFAMPETKIGYFCDAGSSYTLPRVFNNPELGMYLALTSERVTGYNLLELGFSDYYCKQEKFDLLSEKLIELINSIEIKNESEEIDIDFNKHIISKVICFLDEYCDDSYKKFKSRENHSQKFTHIEFINYIFQYDSIFEIMNRLSDITSSCLELKAKQPNLFSLINEETIIWAKKTKNDIEIRSPKAIVSVFELLKLGIKMKKFEEALSFEMKMAMKYTYEPDFIEGIRALVIEKDNNPKWEEKTINEVDYNNLKKEYFSN